MASLTLDNVPDDVADRLRQRAARNGRSLSDEVLAVIAEVEQREGGADHTPAATVPDPPRAVSDRESAMARIRAIQARFPGAANAAQRDKRTPEEIQAELDRFAEMRSHFKGPPLTSEEIIAAIGRESHPPELDRFGNRINPDS
jgi:plasmid stability protein